MGSIAGKESVAMAKAVTSGHRDFVYRLSLNLARSKIDELDGCIHGVIAELGIGLDLIAPT